MCVVVVVVVGGGQALLEDAFELASYLAKFLVASD